MKTVHVFTEENDGQPFIHAFSTAEKLEACLHSYIKLVDPSFFDSWQAEPDPGAKEQMLDDFRESQEPLAQLWWAEEITVDAGEPEPAPQPEPAADPTAAERGTALLDYYTAMDPQFAANEDDSKLGDMLADLMHMAHARGIDYESALDTARDHFREEREDILAEEAEQAAALK